MISHDSPGWLLLDGKVLGDRTCSQIKFHQAKSENRDLNYVMEGGDELVSGGGGDGGNKDTVCDICIKYGLSAMQNCPYF